MLKFFGEKVPEEYTEQVASGLSNNSIKNKMKNGLFKLNIANLQSAIIYGLLTAILAMSLYVISVGDIFALDFKALANAGAFGLLNVIVSLVKNLLTNDEGNFLGVVKVAPPTTE